jgi:hypothetical protein
MRAPEKPQRHEATLSARRLVVTVAVMDDKVYAVAEFLEERRDPIVKDATGRVADARLEHYDSDGSEATSDRLDTLLAVVIQFCRVHRLQGGTDYADLLARERHAGGFPLREVQTAVNVLEEAVWRSVIADVPPNAQGYSLGVVSTVLGTIKDQLACEYVSQFAAQPATTLRMDYLFAGTEGGTVPE